MGPVQPAPWTAPTNSSPREAESVAARLQELLRLVDLLDSQFTDKFSCLTPPDEAQPTAKPHAVHATGPLSAVGYQLHSHIDDLQSKLEMLSVRIVAVSF